MITVKKETSSFAIHAYKFNGWLYRAWEFAKLIFENQDFVCFNTGFNKVITADKKRQGIFHHSKMPPKSIWFFYKNEWFNIRFFYKDNLFKSYVNIASPYVVEDETVKYIDFDIDFEINDMQNLRIKELDNAEFHEHINKYQYPEQIVKKIIETRDKVIKMFHDGEITDLFTRSKKYLIENE